MCLPVTRLCGDKALGFLGADAALVRGTGKAAFAFVALATLRGATLTADFLAAGVAGAAIEALGVDFVEDLTTDLPVAPALLVDADLVTGTCRCAAAGFARLVAVWGEAFEGVLVAIGEWCPGGWVHQGWRWCEPQWRE
jgi:hypothetical protein